MPSTVERLTQKGLITPPSWLASNVAYETIMGSVAFGVSVDISDFDTVGFCIPPKDIVFPHLAGYIEGFGRQKQRFCCYQKHHVFVADELGGKGRTYDLNVYNIVHYFHLCMENNPNMIASLFTPLECVLHSTEVANMVRDKRRMFLHKGCWPRFKGYSFNQLHKMRTKNPEPNSKRASAIEKYGYDCYVEEHTEFLTDRGWQRFDDINSYTQLATVEMQSGEFQWQLPSVRIDKFYTGPVYNIHPAMSKCVVTPGHQILCSPAHRNPTNNFSGAYDKSKATWNLRPLQDFEHGYRSWFHIRRATQPRQEEYQVEDAYLKLAGLFISDGTLAFLNKKVKSGRVTQSKENQHFYKAANALKLTRWDYTKESVWYIPRKIAERLYADFGHGSLQLRLPNWCFQLSHRQADLFFHHLWLGDGTETPNGDVYYSSNEKLAGDIQAMLTAAGHLCSVRGPYIGFSTFTNREVTSFQVYRSHESSFACLDLKRCNKPPRGGKQGNQIQRLNVTNCRVVCFTVPNGTLITRCQGRTAIQGNCKFAYHVVRLLDEVEQILTLGDLDIRRNRAQLKAIRRGEVSEEDIYRWASEKEAALEKAYEESKLPWGPDEPAIKQLLLECLECHYGSIEGCVVMDETPLLALREIAEVIDRNHNLLR